MTATFASLIVLAGLAAADGAKLLDAEFVADIAPFSSVAAPRCEGGAALLEPGTTTFTAAGPFVGDLLVDLRFAATYDGDLSIRFPGAPDFEARIANDGCHLRLGERRIAFPAAPAAEAYSLRVRSQAVELSVGHSPIAFAEFDVPLAGGAIAIELAPRASTKLESVAISRLPFADRDEVIGLDAERARRLANLPLEKFRLVDPVVSRLDPVFRIVVEGEAEEIVAKGRGLRPSEDDIPLLEQALALARIRPLLRFDLFEGEAEVDDPPLARRDDGAYVITKPPGAIRVRSYCGVIGAWPVLVVVDVTRNRVLARLNPGGPSTGDAWATIPKKCDRMRIALVVPDGPTIEHFVDFVRP